MKNYKVISIIILFSFLILSCASTSVGTKVDSTQVKQIEKGKTTEAEVIQMFGKPDQVTFTDNGKTLVYNYSKTSGSVGAGGILLNILTLGIYTPVNTKTESNSLTVLVENDVVKDYVYSEGSQKGVSR